MLGATNIFVALRHTKIFSMCFYNKQYIAVVVF
jgi:hypothetical protein